jgi:hypothetical protein
LFPEKRLLSYYFMNKLQKSALLLLPALFAAELCTANSINTDWGKALAILAFIIFVVALIFIATPIVANINRKSTNNMLNKTAWAMTIITKIASIGILGHFFQALSSYRLLALLSVFPNISINLLLMKAEEKLNGRQFQLSYLIRSILSILVAGSLFSFFMGYSFGLFNYQLLLIFSMLLRFGLSVYFTYRYLILAPVKNVSFPTGWQHPFIFGLMLHLGVYFAAAAMLLVCQLNLFTDYPDVVLTFIFGSFPANVFQLIGTATCGPIAYAVFMNKAKRSGTAD